MNALRAEKLLASHARTFSLTLRLLPRSLREPLGLAYLLARASDTIADAEEIPRERRLALLEVFQGALLHGMGCRSSVWLPEIRAGEFSLADEGLIVSVPELLEELDCQADGTAMLRLWATILEGQIFDVRRFTPEAIPLGREELERYCWLVAGSVGEAWTELIVKHHPGSLCLPPDTNHRERPVSDAHGYESLETMRTLGSGYGKGLQLVNILRDRSADRQIGRIYAPDEELQELLDQAGRWLDQGRRYLSHLCPGRLLYASRLPLELARRTLALIRKEPETPRVKISRHEVYGVLLLSLPSLGLPAGSNPDS